MEEDKKERKKDVYRRVEEAKNSTFDIRKKSFGSPEETLKRLAPNLLQKKIGYIPL